MNRPRLSVILITDEAGDSLIGILERIAVQTIAADIQVVVAATNPDAVDLRAEQVERFGGVRVIAGDLSTSARARADAIIAADAPYIALAEDHCFPKTTVWAERLIAGLDAGHAAVGPRMTNANPSTRTSRASLAVEYGPWMAGGEAREIETLPGHNSAYRRDLLLGYGGDLADMLEAEWVLHRDLRRRGHTLLFDPAIEVSHVNFSVPLSAIRLQLFGGRCFAASRSAGWSGLRRLCYTLASPMIPLVRLVRVARDLRRAGYSAAAVVDTILPMTAVLLSASGLGEGLGYALGDGGRRPDLARMEYRRWRNLVPEEMDLVR